MNTFPSAGTYISNAKLHNVSSEKYRLVIIRLSNVVGVNTRNLDKLNRKYLGQ